MFWAEVSLDLNEKLNALWFMEANGADCLSLRVLCLTKLNMI